MKYAFSCVIAALALTLPVQAEHLAPRNACGTLPGTDAFQMRLATAVANRNADLLEPLVHPEVLLDFGGGSGWEELRARLASPDYDLWTELDKVIRLGCAPSYEGSLAMPLYWSEDLGFDDAFATFVVTGSAVPMRAAPDPDARLVRMLDWEAVEVNMEMEEQGQVYASVRTRAGDSGFVEFAHLRSQVDYRLIADRGDDGAWRITHFIAGD